MKFKSAEEMLGTIQSGLDLFNEEMGIYIFLYNDRGSIAVYNFTKEYAQNLALKAQSIGEYWGALLGSGGYIYDDNSAKEFCEECYSNEWLDTRDYNLSFSWDSLSKDAFADVKEKIKKNETEDGYYAGAVRIGNLSFDLVIRYPDNKPVLFYDLYVGGIDTGYGYSDRPESKGYPYDYADGESFLENVFSMDYEKFKELAEKEFVDYILEENKFYEQADLVAKAKEPLQIW